MTSTFSVRFADEPRNSGYNRTGFSSIETARGWAIDYLRQQKAIENNPFEPVLLVVDGSGQVRDELSVTDSRL